MRTWFKNDDGTLRCEICGCPSFKPSQGSCYCKPGEQLTDPAGTLSTPERPRRQRRPRGVLSEADCRRGLAKLVPQAQHLADELQRPDLTHIEAGRLGSAVRALDLQRRLLVSALEAAMPDEHRALIERAEGVLRGFDERRGNSGRLRPVQPYGVEQSGERDDPGDYNA